jgi:hypothetical protein
VMCPPRGAPVDAAARSIPGSANAPRRCQSLP